MNYKKSSDIAISVKNISKTFRIPHEKMSSLRGTAVNLFRSGGYEEFKALDDVSFEVKKGEFFGIIGRNGSGKSTLLKILANIYQPEKGKIKIDGMVSPFLELGIGFNPELSGRDNVYLNATVLGMTKNQIDEKFNSIVQFSELERFIDQKLKNYSSGMSVRLAFSVAIHANRDILLMDEVLAVGDSNFQKKCIDIFKSYRDNDRTVILVTHDISSVRKYCNRAMLLHDGAIAKIGEVDDVCDEYVLKNLTPGARIELDQKEKEKNAEKNREKELQNKTKNKKQSIFNLNVYDASGKELISIERGQDFFAEVAVELADIPKDLNLAVQIYDRNTNFFVCGNNTYTDGFDCAWKAGRNTIRFNFEDNPLNAGEIYFKAVLFKNNPGGNVILDEFVTDSFVQVVKRNSGGGIVYINHNWKKDEK